MKELLFFSLRALRRTETLQNLKYLILFIINVVKRKMHSCTVALDGGRGGRGARMPAHSSYHV